MDVAMTNDPNFNVDLHRALTVNAPRFVWVRSTVVRRATGVKVIMESISININRLR